MKLQKIYMGIIILEASLITGMVSGLNSHATNENVPQYRMLNNSTGEHFYTSDANERNVLINGGWIYEGITCLIPKKNDFPIYRLCNLINGDHHYTSDIKEKNALVKTENWRDEGIGWFQGGDIPVYRLFNPKSIGVGAHHYTSDENEKNTLTNNGWNYEGIGWYGMSSVGFIDPDPAPEGTSAYNLSDSLTINLKRGNDGEDHFAVLSVTIQQNTNSDAYETYGGKNLAGYESTIRVTINNVVSQHTIEDMRNYTDVVQDEIKAELNKLFGSDLIALVRFSAATYQ